MSNMFGQKTSLREGLQISSQDIDGACTRLFGLIVSFSTFSSYSQMLFLCQELERNHNYLLGY